MTVRLIFAIISTLLEEAALVVIVRWALPEVGVYVSTPVLIALMVVWGAYAVVSYRIASRALNMKQIIGLPGMVGSKGKVVSPLAPEGLVKIKSELWIAKSASGEMELGGEVTVVGQDGLKLVVQDSRAISDSERT